MPWERGGRYFVIANPGELDQDQLFTAPSLAELFDAPTLLLDPNALSADGTIAMTAVRVSPDGRYLAYALSEAGSDWRTIKVLDVETGRRPAGRAALDQMDRPDLAARRVRVPVLALSRADRRASSPRRWAPAS